MKARQAVLGALAAAVTLTVVALAFAVPAAADAPTEIPFEFVFDDVSPCTGDIHTVTIAGTTSVHDHGGRVVAYSERRFRARFVSVVDLSSGTVRVVTGELTCLRPA
jgi:hypothetical protein